MRERENLFNDFLDELRKKEKDEKHQRKEQVRKLFVQTKKYQNNEISHQME